MLVLIQVSSMKTSRRGSSPACQGSPALTPARDVGAGLLKSEQGFFEPQSLALHELPNRIVQDHDAACCQFVLQPVQRQVGRLSDPLHDEGAMRLKHPLAMPAYLARRDRAGRTMALRPFHNRRHGNAEPCRDRPAALPRQNRRNYPLAKIDGQRSGYPMLASSPGSIFNHNFNQTGIPSDSLKP
jgi:hypothetical protein